MENKTKKTSFKYVGPDYDKGLYHNGIVHRPKEWVDNQIANFIKLDALYASWFIELASEK